MMFIHIGNNQVIHVNDIVFIMDYKILDTSPIMEKMLQKAEHEGKIKEKLSDFKSIIITDDLIYYSTLSVVTLNKRSRKQLMFNKENSDLLLNDGP